MSIIFIGIGANLGEPLKQCQRALEYLEKIPASQIIQKSSFYKSEPLTAPLPNPSPSKGEGRKDKEIPPWYINAVCQMETSLSPHHLLKELIGIEEKMGRKRGGKWESRVIDLDILFYDNQIINQDNLIIPHPEIPNRRFVLQPFAEIAPDFIHPILQESISILLAKTTDELKVLTNFSI